MAAYRTGKSGMKPNPVKRMRLPAFRNVLVMVLLMASGGNIAHAQPAGPSGDSASVRQDVEAILSDRDYQREFPVSPAPQASQTRPAAPQPEAPDFRFETDGEEPIRPLPDMVRYVAWTLIAAGAVYLAWLVVRNIRRNRKLSVDVEPFPAGTVEQPGAPHSALEDVERLARNGALAEAVHMLLLRFIADIRTRQGTDVQPALTSREVVASVSLPQAARTSLAFIVASVERTRFGGMEIDRATFERCLDGYRNFALHRAKGR